MTSWGWKWFLRVLSGWGDSWYAPHPRFEPGLKIRHLQMCFPTKTYWNLHVYIHLRGTSQFLYVWNSVNILKVDDVPMKPIFWLLGFPSHVGFLRPAPLFQEAEKKMRKLLKGLAKNQAEVIFGILQLCAWDAWLVMKPQINWIFSSSPRVQKCPKAIGVTRKRGISSYFNTINRRCKPWISLVGFEDRTNRESETYRESETKNQKLKAANQKLKSANQKPKSRESETKNPANQKLKCTNPKQNSANQKLRIRN